MDLNNFIIRFINFIKEFIIFTFKKFIYYHGLILNEFIAFNTI